MATTLGALYVALPLFTLAYLISLFFGFSEYPQPQLWSLHSIASIVYLGLFASLIGFIAYFYILQKLNSSTVALITLITPTFAILLGALVNNETVTANIAIGAVAVLCGLALYSWGDKWIFKPKSHFARSLITKIR